MPQNVWEVLSAAKWTTTCFIPPLPPENNRCQQNCSLSRATVVHYPWREHSTWYSKDSELLSNQLQEEDGIPEDHGMSLFKAGTLQRNCNVAIQKCGVDNTNRGEAVMARGTSVSQHSRQKHPNTCKRKDIYRPQTALWISEEVWQTISLSIPWGHAMPF
jgi:hypothetical protein